VLKTKYWIYENGIGKKASYNDFRYYYDNFCTYVMDKRGNVLFKDKVPIREVELIYNSFGVGIAGRNIINK